MDASRFLWWGMGASAVVFAASLILLPWLVARLPATYFSHPMHRGGPLVGRHPFLHRLIELVKTALGALLVLLGIALLVLPGQGLLMILAGVFLMSFPGKYRLERWLVTRRPVWRALQWLRQRMGKPRLVI